ncbi:MAG TPA: KOW motif-containing protein [Pyrinomonadaceae bacterium]|jgi:transcriptional antiterminator NusG
MTIFRLGDTVRIKSGAFQAFTGRIDGINQSRMLLKVKVKVCGKTLTTKLGFSEVYKVKFFKEDVDDRA